MREKIEEFSIRKQVKENEKRTRRHPFPLKKECTCSQFEFTTKIFTPRPVSLFLSLHSHCLPRMDQKWTIGLSPLLFSSLLPSFSESRNLQVTGSLLSLLFPLRTPFISIPHFLHLHPLPSQVQVQSCMCPSCAMTISFTITFVFSHTEAGKRPGDY